MTTELSLKETLLEKLKTQSEVRISGSVVEYFSLLDELEGTEITVEFNENEIISYMSQATEIHELMVGNIIIIIGNKLWDTDSRVYGSNRPVYATECKKGFNPDVLIVKGATELYPRERQVAATLNPRVVIEVLSDSNQGIGFLEKISCYKKIQTLQQILLINQYKPSISSYLRTSENEWLNHEYDGLDENIKIEDFTIASKDIYRNVF
jgi:Uma2 family endonuclease